MDLKRVPYRLKTIRVPGCAVGEDIVFSDDNKTWYLTCMGSNNIIVGDAVADKPVKTLAATGKAFIKYPHGIAVHGGIDRILVTSTVRASDLGDAGVTVTEIEASSGKVLATHKVAGNPAKGKAPVEILFLPRSNPPRAYITNMFGGTISLATWSPGKKTFSVKQVFDLSPHKAGVPLEMYFNEKGDRLYLTTANPGAFHIIDIKNPEKPKMLKTIPAAGGAHHVAFDKEGKYAFVQNNLLDLKGMNDGSITVIDMKKEKRIGSIDTFKNRGLLPNLIVLLPEWNLQAGH
jgi:DNA-binding beta-propeller fold protein YncE